MKPEGLTSEKLLEHAREFQKAADNTGAETPTQLAAALRIAAAVVDEGAAERVARIVARDIARQDDMAPGEFVLAGDTLSVPYLDQGEVSFREVARAVIDHLTGGAGDGR